MSTYVEVPREAMIAMLEGAGFNLDDEAKEITYVRHHVRDQRLSVRVYTSIAKNSNTARGCGKDAIRVVALFEWLHKPTQAFRIKKLWNARVFRAGTVEGVLERTLGKMREAYGACNDFLAKSERR